LPPCSDPSNGSSSKVFFQLDRPPRRPPPSCPLTGTSHVRSLLVPCWPETDF
ncbi:hypothetical protein T09_1110, partial [Trichinella sp. T9]